MNKTRTRLCNSAAAVILVLGLSPFAAAADRASVTATAPAIRIDNFGRVDDALYRGAQPVGRDFADLKSLGVKTVVNLTSDDADPNEKASTEAAGMTYVQIPMSTRIVPTKAQLAQFLAIVNDPAAQPVYVHCVGGRHRTGVMTAAYRMTHEGWTGDKAFQEMKQYKFGADFLHPEFKQFVYGFRPEKPAVNAENAVAVTTSAPATTASASAATSATIQQ